MVILTVCVIPLYLPRPLEAYIQMMSRGIRQNRSWYISITCEKISRAGNLRNDLLWFIVFGLAPHTLLKIAQKFAVRLPAQRPKCSSLSVLLIMA